METLIFTPPDNTMMKQIRGSIRRQEMDKINRIPVHEIDLRAFRAVNLVLSAYFNQHSKLRTGNLYKMMSASQSNPIAPYLKLLTDDNSLGTPRGCLDS
jgi:hypothetical protein